MTTPSFINQLAPNDRFEIGADFRDVIHCFPGEHILVCHPFGWHCDGKHIPNCPEQWSIEEALSTIGIELVTSYGDFIHVVRKVAA